MEAEWGSWQHVDLYIFAHSHVQSSTGINAHRRKLVYVNAQSSQSCRSWRREDLRLAGFLGLTLLSYEATCPPRLG